MPGRVMVLLVCSGAVLGFLNIYQPIVSFAKAGASVPLLGFGNLLWKGVKEAVRKDGLIGNFYRRIYSERCRNFGGTCIWIPWFACV